MKKQWLLYLLAGLLLIAQLAVVGCKQQPKLSDDEDTEEPTPDPEQNDPEPDGPPVSQEYQVTSIKFGLFNAKGELEPYKDKDGKVEKDDKNNDVMFKEAKNFDKTLSGIYVLENNPETAYIAVQIDKPKPDEGADFVVYIKNENSFLAPIRLYRKKPVKPEEDGLYSTEESVSQTNIDANRVVCLAKGENIIIVEIELAGEKAEYKFKVNYGGGPEDNPKDKKQNLIPGIYCPTMRKLSQEEHDAGEKDEALLMIFMAGW